MNGGPTYENPHEDRAGQTGSGALLPLRFADYYRYAWDHRLDWER